MGKISYTELDDMAKYNTDFDRSLYEGMEEAEVIPIFKKYYAEHLPIDLLTWIRVNKPNEEMIYRKSWSNQVVFVRDSLNEVFYSTYDDFKANPVMVINTHRSKSISLPVYEITLKKYGVRMILRNNFYDWKVSVISERDIDTDFMGLFKQDEEIHSVYCEGFEEEQVFGSYSKNKKQFTFEISGEHKIYTFMFLLNNYLKNRPELGSITDKEIDAFGKFTDEQKKIIKEQYSKYPKGFFPNPMCALY